MQVLSSRVLLHPVDLERSIAFYGGTLGLHVYREYGSGSSRGVVYFLGGGFLEVSPSTAPPNDDHAPRLALWLQVPDLDDTEAHLRKEGVTIDKPAERMPWGLEELWARDPDGVRLVFVEVPEDHPLRRRQ